MATIEPRLIHLLNTPQPPDLPPIQLLPFGPSASESLSLPPLEPDARQRADKPLPIQLSSRYAVNEDPSARQTTRPDNTYVSDAPSRSGISTFPVRMLVDDTPDTLEDLSTKKRHRALTTKDDFVQLPQPLKKQKSTQQVVPPIINGLHEPPPNAAVFPPITSGSFDEDEAFNLNLLKEFTSSADDRTATAPTSDVDKNNGGTKAKRRAAKPRKKWSEEETNHLLLGVSRHGVGKWTSILEDPDFKFNERTAGDLKDRFRTCCPIELRGSTSRKRSEEDAVDHGAAADDNQRPRHGLHLENILTEPDSPAEKDGPSSSSQLPDSDSISIQRKSRSHRKNVEHLYGLGISPPFKRSHRRERRPFMDHDDKEILEGLDKYGPAWTKIQRDPKYNLSSRQPTDLRDRVRNKYPDIYARIEKGNLQLKESGRGGNVLEPSIHTTISNSLNNHGGISGPGLEPQLTRTASKEDMLKWIPNSAFYESTESLPGLADMFDMSEPAGTSLPSTAPEMDISRLLLGDSKVSAGEQQQQQQPQHMRYGGHDQSSNRASPAGGTLPPPIESHYLKNR
ncbi:hypothetical protein B0T17DRAFT_491223 [Bombardia bombarda]|uniref:Myb-like domain-containing protein n=1 Tax=Bombardia bombarda TaxID=252184 RepID=A0AA39X7F7_9PEZI|nr:hypothetical protein B0T17DRAFT_491223 [Bombardia bombarda]